MEVILLASVYSREGMDIEFAGIVAADKNHWHFNNSKFRAGFFWVSIDFLRRLHLVATLLAALCEASSVFLIYTGYFLRLADEFKFNLSIFSVLSLCLSLFLKLFLFDEIDGLHFTLVDCITTATNVISITHIHTNTHQSTNILPFCHINISAALSPPTFHGIHVAVLNSFR